MLAAGFFALRSVLKSPGDNKYSEIEKLVTNSQYHEALAIIENLPARLRLDTVISGFYRKCRVKVSVDSISALIGTGQFLPAMRFHENLPEEISSDSILQVLYHQSEMLLVTDSLSRMVANSDFSEGRKYYEGLSSQLKNDPKIDSVYRKLLYLIKIDSLKTEGNEFFENKEYKRSADIFNLILKKYDRSNQYADSMIKVINALNQVKEPEPEIIIPSEGCLKFYSGRTLKYESAPDTRIVRMFSICLKQSEMIITIQIQPLDYDITIFNPLTDRAFYLEYYSGSGKQPLRLKDIPPPTKVDRRIRISKPTTVNLVFPRLPEGVTKFDLLEGRNQRDPNQKYWNFTGIRLI